MINVCKTASFGLLAICLAATFMVLSPSTKAMGDETGNPKATILIFSGRPNPVFLIENDQICILNPSKFDITTPRFLKGMINLFANHYKMKVQISDEGSIYVLQFSFKESLDPDLIRVNLKNIDNVVGWDEKSIICEIIFNDELVSYTGGSEEKITVKDLQELFREINDLASSSLKGTD